MGIKQVEGDINLSVYPNPTNGSFIVNSSEKINEINIFNSLGECVHKEKPNSQNVNLQVDKTGIYFVSIKTVTGVFTKRIIVQH